MHPDIGMIGRGGRVRDVDCQRIRERQRQWDRELAGGLIVSKLPEHDSIQPNFAATKNARQHHAEDFGFI